MFTHQTYRHCYLVYLRSHLGSSPVHPSAVQLRMLAPMSLKLLFTHSYTARVLLFDSVMVVSGGGTSSSHCTTRSCMRCV